MNPAEARHPGNTRPAAPSSTSNGKPPSGSDAQLLQTLMSQANGESSGPAALAMTPTFSGLLQALRRRWPVATGFATAAAVTAILAVFQVMPPKYMVSHRIRVAAAKQPGVEDIEFPIIKANMEALFKSPVVLKAALDLKTKDNSRDIKDLGLVSSKGMGAVDWLEKSLKTDFLLGPEVLRVTLPADEGEDAAELLNAIGRAFLDQVNEMELAKRQQRLDELRKTKAGLERQLEAMRGTLNRMFDVKDPQAADRNHQLLTARLVAAEQAKGTLDTEITKLDTKALSIEAGLKGLRANSPDEGFFAFTAQDDVIKEYRKGIADANKKIADIKAGYYERYWADLIPPQKTRIASLEASVAQRERELIPDYEKLQQLSLRTVKETIKGLKHQRDIALKDIEQLDAKVRQAGFNEPAQIAMLKEKIEVAAQSLKRTAEKMTDVENEGLNSRVSILEWASPPTNKDVSRQTKIAGAGGLGLFCLVLFGVAMFEFRLRKISLPEDVTQGLGINVVGTVPAIPARPKKSTPASEAQEQLWQHQLHESVDAIRTVLLHNARNDDSMRIIMVTSASSGEGKTTLATQLAASLARAWKRVLIIDGDLRHPATHKLFEIAQEPGLAEVLRGEVDLADTIRATAISRLWVLPAGHGDSHAIQALAQDNVAEILTTLKEQYDFIIVDSPPLLPVTDSLLLGQHVDGVLLAILRDVSRAPAVYAAQQKLLPLGVHMLGAVVLGTSGEYGDNNYRYAMMPSK